MSYESHEKESPWEAVLAYTAGTLFLLWALVEFIGPGTILNWVETL